MFGGGRRLDEGTCGREGGGVRRAHRGLRGGGKAAAGRDAGGDAGSAVRSSARSGVGDTKASGGWAGRTLRGAGGAGGGGDHRRRGVPVAEGGRRGAWDGSVAGRLLQRVTALSGNSGGSVGLGGQIGVPTVDRIGGGLRGLRGAHGAPARCRLGACGGRSVRRRGGRCSSCFRFAVC